MQFIDTHHDQWHTVGGEDGPMAHPPIKSHSLLTLAQWHAVRDQWPAKDAADHKPVGVILANDTDIEVLEADAAKLSLVVLQFPKWTDGRAYTQARILRARYRFGGEIRATGDVLVDMMPLLARTGFNAVVLRADQDRAAAERALGFFGARGHYQGDVQQTRPVFGRAA
ncbi:DUF934 domain-containing protein [Aquabacterium sp. A3]|uniref:DUF934 domain-containing protein n=1 Tax=Aquabacterium sp. A3 TaxID=3132829 RepID=UPI0031198CD8